MPLEEVGVIISKRDPTKIVNSLLRVGCSPLVPLGRDWIMTPLKKNPICPPPSFIFSPKFSYYYAAMLAYIYNGFNWRLKNLKLPQLPSCPWLNLYEVKCLNWYVSETYKMAELFKSKFPNVTYFETNIEDLNSVENVNQMLNFFGLQSTDCLNSIVGKPTNRKRF